MTDTKCGPKHWLAIACADHVERGQAEGFMQVCHGKASPLRRIREGDGILYYSPTQSMGGKDHLQSFTAQGIVGSDAMYQVDMGNGFFPYRRNVRWNKVQVTAIRPHLDALELTKGKSKWAYPFRFGLLEISANDFHFVTEAMLIKQK